MKPTWFIRFVRTKPVEPSTRLSTLVALSDVLRSGLALSDAPMAKGRGFVETHMISGPAFHQLAEQSRSTAGPPSAKVPTHSLRFAPSAQSLLVVGTALWSELPAIEHRWGLDVRLELRARPDDIRDVMFSTWRALDADRAWCSDDRARCFGGSTTLLPPECLVRSIHGLGDVRYEPAASGFWVLSDAGAAHVAGPLKPESFDARHVAPLPQREVPSYALSVASQAALAQAESSPDETLPLPDRGALPKPLQAEPGGPRILATMMAIHDIPITEGLPFASSAATKHIVKIAPSSPGSPPDRHATGTVAPSKGNRRSMPFVRSRGAPETSISAEEIDLSLFPLERYALVTAALARGEPRSEVLQRFRLTDALFSALGSAWLIHFDREPTLYGRFKELVASAK